MDSYEIHTDTAQIYPSTETEIIHTNNTSPSPKDSNTYSSVIHDNEDHGATLGSFEGERVPLCAVDPDYGHSSEHNSEATQPRFLHGFEPRTTFLEAVPVVTRQIRSIDLHLGRRRRRGEPEGEQEVNNKWSSITLWLVLSIFSILCCGWFFGFFALVFVCQAREERSRGRYSTSRHALLKARVLLLVAFGIGAVVWIAFAYRLYEVTHTSHRSHNDTDLQSSTNSTTPSSVVDH